MPPLRGARRLVEWKDDSGIIYELMYSPAGAKIAVMTGQTLAVGRIPLPGGAIASYGSGGLNNYAHADWLGSTCFSSYAATRTMKWDLAHAPYGEVYALAGGGAEFTFTGQFSDYGSTNTLWDFPLREYHSSQGRWISPDPAGLAAVNPMNPQTWNRYAYVGGNPLNAIDPLGLQCVTLQDGNGNSVIGDDGTQPPCDHMTQGPPVDVVVYGDGSLAWLEGNAPSYPGSFYHAPGWVRQEASEKRNHTKNPRRTDTVRVYHPGNGRSRSFITPQQASDLCYASVQLRYNGMGSLSDYSGDPNDSVDQDTRVYTPPSSRVLNPTGNQSGATAAAAGAGFSIAVGKPADYKTCMNYYYSHQ